MNMRWRLKSCPRENVSLLASGVLPAGEQSRVREHLARCAECRNYFEKIARVSGDLQQWANTEPPLQPSTGFRARWTQQIQRAAVRRLAFTRPWLIARWSEWLWPSPLAWGALAAIWVGLFLLQWTIPAQRATQPEVASV